jgi:hypothetical protein
MPVFSYFVMAKYFLLLVMYLAKNPQDEKNIYRIKTH